MGVSATMGSSLIALSIAATAAAQTPKPVPRIHHPPQGVPNCSVEKVFGTIKGYVRVGSVTSIELTLPLTKLEGNGLEVGDRGLGNTSLEALEPRVHVSIKWAAGKEYSATGAFHTARIPWPVGGKRAVKTFKHTVTVGETSVRKTMPNGLGPKAAELTLSFVAPKTGMIGFLRAGDAAGGTITSVALDSARASRSLTMTASVEGIGAALDELIKEADKRTADWSAGRCK